MQQFSVGQKSARRGSGQKSAGLRPLIGFLALGFLAGSVEQSHAQAQTQSYDITVETSTLPGAGTNADVFITLYGPKGPQEGVKLQLDSNADDFEPGSKRTYRVSTTTDLGGVASIKLEHDNTHPGPGWHVKTVGIRDPSGEEILFAPNRWLAKTEGDRQIEWSARRADYAEWIKKKTELVFTTPEGRWTPTCGGGQNCNAQLHRSLTVGGSDTETLTNEFSSSLSVEVSTEAMVFGQKFGVSVTAGLAQAHTKASEIARTFSDNQKEICGTNVDMVEFNVHQVWQWTVSSSLGPKPVVIRTCQIACTPGPAGPNFLPNDQAAVGSCLVRRAAPQVAAPVPTPAVVPTPVAVVPTPVAVVPTPVPAAPVPTPVVAAPIMDGMPALDPTDPDVIAMRNEGWTDEEIQTELFGDGVMETMDAKPEPTMVTLTPAVDAPMMEGMPGLDPADPDVMALRAEGWTDAEIQAELFGDGTMETMDADPNVAEGMAMEGPEIFDYDADGNPLDEFGNIIVE